MRDGKADRVGIAASTLCAAHCGASALLAGTAGWLGAVGGERAETVLATGAVALAIASLSQGYRTHSRLIPAAIAVAGITLLLLARFAVNEPRDLPVALSAASLLITAHWLNLRAYRQMRRCCGDARPGYSHRVAAQ